LPELVVARAVALVGDDEGVALAESLDGSAQVLADRLAEQRDVAGAVGVGAAAQADDLAAGEPFVVGQGKHREVTPVWRRYMNECESGVPDRPPRTAGRSGRGGVGSSPAGPAASTRPRD